MTNLQTAINYALDLIKCEAYNAAYQWLRMALSEANKLKARRLSGHILNLMRVVRSKSQIA